MNLNRIGAAILMLPLLLVSRAGAVEIYFDTLPATLENGTYNGFVGGKIDDVRFDNLICNDFLPTTYVPSGPWAYDVSTLSGPNQLEYARFGDAFDAIAKYEQAALLLAGDGTPKLPGLMHVSSADEITSYQYAIWRLFTPGRDMSGHGATVINPGTSDMLLSTVAGENLSDPRFTPIYQELRVYTPGDSAKSNQEFLQVAPTPEPGTWTMVGISVALLGTAVYRRRARNR
jgi:hypothetical protein